MSRPPKPLAWPALARAARRVPGSAEDALRELVQVGGPALAVVAVAVDVPHMGYVLLPQCAVHPLRDADQSVLAAAGQVQQGQLAARGGRIGQQLLGRAGV